MPGSNWKRINWGNARAIMCVGVTDAAGGNANQHVGITNLRKRDFNFFQWPAKFNEPYRFHCAYRPLMLIQWWRFAPNNWQMSASVFEGNEYSSAIGLNLVVFNAHIELHDLGNAQIAQ